MSFLPDGSDAAKTLVDEAALKLQPIIDQAAAKLAEAAQAAVAQLVAGVQETLDGLTVTITVTRRKP